MYVVILFIYLSVLEEGSVSTQDQSLDPVVLSFFCLLFICSVYMSYTINDTLRDLFYFVPSPCLTTPPRKPVTPKTVKFIVLMSRKWLFYRQLVPFIDCRLSLHTDYKDTSLPSVTLTSSSSLIFYPYFFLSPLSFPSGTSVTVFKQEIGLTRLLCDFLKLVSVQN